MVTNMSLKLCFFMCLSGFLIQAKAWEVDNFSNRKSLKELPDANSKLSSLVNERLKKAINDYNKNENIACSEITDFGKGKIPKLYGYLRGVMNSGQVSNFIDSSTSSDHKNSSIETYSDQSTDMQEYRLAVSGEDSIYSLKNLNWFDRTATFLFETRVMGVLGIQSSLNVNGHIVGADKFGHFTEQGFEYFEGAWSDGGNIQKVLERGNEQENGGYGLETTGVKSYGDLSANFKGFQFWRNLLYGPSPMLECNNGKFSLKKKFLWSDYIDDSWDQGINCSEFKSGLERGVNRNLDKLEIKCPVEEDKCLTIVKNTCANFIVDPKCLELAKEKKVEVNQYCPISASADFDYRPDQESLKGLVKCNQNIQQLEVKDQAVHKNLEKEIDIERVQNLAIKFLDDPNRHEKLVNLNLDFMTINAIENEVKYQKLVSKMKSLGINEDSLADILENSPPVNNMIVANAIAEMQGITEETRKKWKQEGIGQEAINKHIQSVINLDVLSINTRFMDLEDLAYYHFVNRRKQVVQNLKEKNFSDDEIKLILNEAPKGVLKYKIKERFKFSPLERKNAKIFYHISDSEVESREFSRIQEIESVSFFADPRLKRCVENQTLSAIMSNVGAVISNITLTTFGSGNSITACP